MTAAELYTKGARIWIPDADEVWRAAELLDDYTGQKQLKIQYEEGEESVIEIKYKNLPHLRNPDILIGENDLTSLSYLNEPEVLYNLQVRFVQQNLIYTYCGIVLVAINPYEQLDIYNNDIIQAYSGQDMGTMDPHIFAVAEEAFKRMSRFDQNQSIIVSGESGAGKTVSAKYAMRYFATVGGSQAESETQVEKKVLASNPIMESIGNAKTTRNDNSSRFGKYIEITFSTKHEIIGANMRTYLLEKSRVVFQAQEERNYHIFYQLCASKDLPGLAEMKLSSADDFYYTSQGGAPEISGVDDANDLELLQDAFSLLGFASKDQLMIFRIMSAVLHFGNINIREKEGECCEIPKQDDHLSTMCRLLAIEESQMRMWLCNRQIQTVNETLIKPLSENQASFARDALAKHIYSQMFDWIVAHINRVLRSSGKTSKLNFIGVLDIYGFETFEINSFEQFCINYANEKLQQIFNMHVFKLEQEEYVREKIEWSFIDFYDNQPCIDLIENRLGILDLLDEECKMPKGSDKNWCQKLYDKHLKTSKHFEKPRMSMTAFIIVHFADKVTYTADGFLEKNRDTILEEQINILKASEHEMVAELFMEGADVDKKKSRSGSVTVTPLRQSAKTGSKQHKKTVGSQFRDSLKLLMDTLNATSPHYIRCIKPNDDKEAFTFHSKRAVEQLRACGVLETIRISAAGYPSRWTYSEFFHRYRVLASSKDINKKNMLKTCENILTKLITDPDKYRFGKTKIFFRAGQVAYLEKLRADKLRACGVMIQKHIKGWLQRRKYRRIQRSCLLVQTWGRGLLARRKALFLRQTRAATIIQSSWRKHQKCSRYNKLRNTVVQLQACIRGMFARRRYVCLIKEHRAIQIQSTVRTFLARKRFKRFLRGIVLLQSHVRRRRARRELKQLKIEAKSVEHIKNVNKGLENKIIELQQKLDSRGKKLQELTVQEGKVEELKTEIQKLKTSEVVAKTSSNRLQQLEEKIAELEAELELERGEKKDIMSEKDELMKVHKQTVSEFEDEQVRLKEELNAANIHLQQQELQNAEIIKEKLEAANKLLIEEFNSERGHHQKLVREHARLQQRLENLQGEMSVLKSPTSGHHRTPSDISAVSVDSFGSSADAEKAADEEREEDQGYETAKRKAAPPTDLLSKVMNEVTGQKEGEQVDVGLLLKLQNRVKELERDKQHLQRQVERLEDDSPRASPTMLTDSAFDTLKQQMGANADDVALVIKLQKRVKELEVVKTKLTNELEERDENEYGEERIGGDLAYESLKMQELQNENDKLKREVSSLNLSIAESTNFDKGKNMSPAGRRFLDELEAMRDELDRRRDECLHLRAELADRSISTHAVAKEQYGGHDEMVNEDNEIVMAFKTQKDLNRSMSSA